MILFVYKIIGAVHNVRSLLCESKLTFQFVLRPQIVIIQKRDILAFGLRDSCVSRIRYTNIVRQCNDSNPVVALRFLLNQLQRIIRGAVIYYQ